MDNFDDPYLVDEKYTSVLNMIMGKTGRVREEGNERISGEETRPRTRFRRST